MTRARDATNIDEFEKIYPFRTIEERLHGIGAHEAAHLDNPNAYEAESEYEEEVVAFEVEKRARKEYVDEND